MPKSKVLAFWMRKIKGETIKFYTKFHAICPKFMLQEKLHFGKFGVAASPLICDSKTLGDKQMDLIWGFDVPL